MRTLKPNAIATVRREHPLARGLQALWLFSEGSGQVIRDACGGPSASVVSGEPTWQAGPAGWACGTPATRHIATGRRTFGTTTLLCASGQAFTLAMRVRMPSSGFGCTWSVARGATIVAALIYNSGPAALQIRGGSAAVLAGLANNTYREMVLVWTGSALTIYVDGVATSASPGGGADDAAALLMFNCYSSDSPTFQGDTRWDYAAVWDRALTAGEVARLAIERYDLAGPSLSGMLPSIGAMIGRGFNSLLRWSGELYPLPGHPVYGAGVRDVQVVGVTDGDSETVLEEFELARLPDTVYHYTVVGVTPGGKANDVLAGEVITRVTDGDGELLGPLPNPPAHLTATAGDGGVPVLQWAYSHSREGATPATFEIFAAEAGQEFDFGDPIDSVAWVEGITIYDWVGDALTPGDQRYYVVRAKSSEGVMSLVPRLGKSPSGDYLDAGVVDAVHLVIPEAPTAPDAQIAEVA